MVRCRLLDLALESRQRVMGALGELLGDRAGGAELQLAGEVVRLLLVVVRGGDQIDLGQLDDCG